MAKKKQQKKSFTQMSIKDIKAARKRKELEKELEHPDFEPTLPSVDLFPEEVRDTIKVKKTKTALLVVGGAVLLAVGGMWYVQGQNISSAQETLAAATADNNELQEQIRALTPVKAFYDEISAQEAIVNGALAADVSSTGVMDALNNLATKTNVSFGNTSIQYTGSPKSQVGGAKGGQGICPSIDPFSTIVTVGCVTFTAESPDREAVANFLTQAEEDPYFISPYVSNTTATDVGTNFNGSLALTPDALMVPLTPEQLQVLMNPPEKKKTTKPTEDAAAGDAASE